jgi:hypothetical protein
MYNNLTKTINAYDNKTLAAITKNITQTSVEITRIVESVNATNATARDMVSGLANSTAKKGDVKRVQSDQVNAATLTGIALVSVTASLGLLHMQNWSAIAKHDKLLWSEPKQVPKASAKKVDKK